MNRIEIEQRIVDFLSEIGIGVEYTTLPDETFLPGVYVKEGRLCIDSAKLRYPGDLLHEAGHLAVVPSGLRDTFTGEVNMANVAMEPIEVQAMAWSYAAALHLGLDPSVVFHADGYHGQSRSLLLNFQLGVYLGVQALEDSGLTLAPNTASAECKPGFPTMIKWLCD
jgi:hypothetical protein